MFRRGTKRPRFSLGGHPVFEHDDSSNHSGLGMLDYEEDLSSQQHNTTISNSSDSNFLYHQFVPDRPRRAPKSITKSHQDDNTNLNACLDHLLRIVSRKDKEGFFQYPVTDQLAPGYSTIIARPMDFSTMKKKINQDDYYNILEFRADFELMCENAMKYNRPDTIYWQAAKRLLATGSKLMNKDKLLSFRRSLECFSRLTERELGFRIDSLNHTTDEQISSSTEQLDSSTTDHENLSSISISQACSQRKPKLILKLPKYCEKIPAVIPDEEDEEEFSPEEILLQAKQAALCAREKLNLRSTICSYTLTYQRVNGKTSLRYVNQDDCSQQTITLGETNALSSNDSTLISSTLPVVHGNEKQNYLQSKHYLENGPFSSNASQCDSTFSSIPKEELDLLIHTYGSEFSAQYAVSLMDYVKDSGDLALAYVDRFLSVLTNGEHDNFILKTREKKPKIEENDHQTSETVTTNNVQSSSSLLNISSNQIKQEPTINTNDNLQHPQSNSTFDDNSTFQMQFCQTQYEHLSQTHQAISSVQQQQAQPTNDYDLAEKVLFNITDIPQISNGPDQPISSETIHHNLGMMHNNDSTFDTL